MRTLIIVVCCLALLSCGEDNPDPTQMNQITAPTQAASAVAFSKLTPNSITISWTNGNGSKRLALIKEGSAVDATPVDGQSYTANATFGSGDELGTGNFVVLNGNSNSVIVTALRAQLDYYFAIYEYNGDGAEIKFLVSAKAEANQTTPEEDASLIGSWLFGTAESQDGGLLTFIDEGTFMLVADGQADDGGQPGIERGTYTLDPSTGNFTGTPITSTIGDWGLSDLAYPVTLTISGNILVFTDQEESIQFSKVVPMVNNDLLGGWLQQDALDPNQITVVTFIDETNFMLGADDEADAEGGPGMERGTYTWNAGSGTFVATVIADTNGDLGLNPDSNSGTATVDGDNLTYDDGDGSVVFTRIK